MQKREQKLLEVGFYLSKFGADSEQKEYALPPNRLNCNKWNEAYRMFYEGLNGGRTVLTFERTLKNVRDAYDSHLKQSGRQGWKTSGQNPNPLTKDAQKVFDNLKDKSEKEIWQLIKESSDLRISEYSLQFSDLIGIQQSEVNIREAIVEGGKKIIISSVYERSPSVRKKAIDLHGTKCQICGFDFTDYYGDWGKGFIEVHHIQSLADHEGESIKTNPETDLATICANCHRMIHRKAGKTLSIEELRNKLKKRH